MNSYELDATTKEFIAIDFIEKIIYSDDLLDKLDDYENNVSLFGDNYNKNDYIDAIENYYYAHFTNKYKPKDETRFYNSLNTFVNKFFDMKSSDIFSSRVASLLIQIKLDYYNDTDNEFVKNINNLEMFDYIKENIQNNYRGITDEFYDEIVNKDNSEIIVDKLVNFAVTFEDKDTITRIFNAADNSSQFLMVNQYSVNNLIDIKQINMDTVMNNPSVITMILKQKKFVETLSTPEMSKAKELFFMLPDNNKCAVLASPLFTYVDEYAAMNLLGSINDINAKMVLIRHQAEILKHVTYKTYPLFLSGIDEEQLFEYLMKSSHLLCLNGSDEYLFLSAIINIQNNDYRNQLIEIGVNENKDILSKTAISKIVSKTYDGASLKKLFENKHINEKLNIFDYSFILQETFMNDNTRKEIMNSDIVKNKALEYGINIDSNMDINTLFATLNNKYAMELLKTIQIGELKPDLLNTTSISKGSSDCYKLVDKNSIEIVKKLCSNGSDYAFDKEFVERLFVSFTIDMFKQDNLELNACTTTSTGIKRCLGTYNHGYKDIKINANAISKKMKNNFDVLNTIFHEKHHAKQFTAMESSNDIGNIDNLSMVKDNILSRYLSTPINKEQENFQKRNYRVLSYESDARCMSLVETKKMFRNMEVKELDEYIESYKKEMTNTIIEKKNRFRNEFGENYYDLDSLYDAVISKEDIAKLTQLNPILLREYNEDGSKKNILDLFYDREVYKRQLEQLNYSKEELSSDKSKLDEYSLYKKNVTFYDKLLDRRKNLSLTDDLKTPIFNLQRNFEDWSNLLLDVIDGDSNEEKVEYLESSIRNMNEFEIAANEKFIKPESVTYFYNMSLQAFANEIDLNSVNKKDEYELTDILNILEQRKETKGVVNEDGRQR